MIVHSSGVCECPKYSTDGRSSSETKITILELVLTMMQPLQFLIGWMNNSMYQGGPRTVLREASPGSSCLLIRAELSDTRTPLVINRRIIRKERRKLHHIGVFGRHIAMT
jgi:hypothetical protein